MDTAQLRGRQRPLKDRYRVEPDAASVPAQAVGVVDTSTMTCRVHSEAGDVVSGLHPATGGDVGLACSADLLLGAVAACAGVTLAAVATSMGIALGPATRVVVRGHWDARGTLGVDPDVPVGMTDISVVVEVDTDAADDQVRRLITLTERYCVIAQTLIAPPVVSVVGGRASG